MATFRIATTEQERRWPPAGSRVIALLTLQPSALEQRLGVPLTSGVEDGLGPWTGIGLILPSGRQIEFVWYEHLDQSSPTELRAATGEDYAAVLSETVDACHLEPTDIAWVPPGGAI